MNRRIFTLPLPKLMAHNCLTLTPQSEDIKIISISTYTVDNVKVQLIKEPIALNAIKAIRYNNLVSSSISIEIEHMYVKELDIDDLVFAELGLSEYSHSGKLLTKEMEISANEFIHIMYDIGNIGDSLCKATIFMQGLDRFGNIVFAESVPFSVNDDGHILEYANTSNGVALSYSPIEDSVSVFIDGNQTSEFTIDSNFIAIEIPNNSTAYIKYRPSFLDEGIFVDISNFISINSSWTLKLREKNCVKLKYRIGIETYNMNITSTNSTPVIKRLAVISSSK